MKPSVISKALALCACTLAGCGSGELEPLDDSQLALLALQQLTRYAPSYLPGPVPQELLQVTMGGAEYDIGELLGRPAGARPYARIAAAYRASATPENPPPWGQPSLAVVPDYTLTAPAAQVYECRQEGSGYAWAFLGPEAGLQPIATQPIPGLSELVLDHFRYPGGIDFGPPTGTPPAGPVWRVSAPALNQGSPMFGQTLFIGAIEALADNGPGNIPLLRVANVARIDQGVPIDPFSRTLPDGLRAGFVLRLNTMGGVAPATGCGAAADLGQRYRSPYVADYYFINVIAGPAPERVSLPLAHR
jgi:hypothetical protein